VSILLHVIFIFLDHFVPFSLTQLLVPFLSNYRQTQWFGVNVGSVWVAAGIVAFYLVALIVLSSLLVIDRAKRTWKFLHYGSYLVVGLIFLHGLYLGTDLATGWSRWLWFGFGSLVLVAIISRLWRVGTLKPRDDRDKPV
jgi:sulfoxide reductase heme-binding subunit YedZ